MNVNNRESTLSISTTLIHHICIYLGELEVPSFCSLKVSLCKVLEKIMMKQAINSIAKHFTSYINIRCALRVHFKIETLEGFISYYLLC